MNKQDAEIINKMFRLLTKHDGEIRALKERVKVLEGEKEVLDDPLGIEHAARQSANKVGLSQL